MKYTIFSIFVLFTLSCTVEESSKSTFETQISSSRSDQPNELETKMQWVSFITGIVLEQDLEAREEIANLISNENKTLSLYEIIGGYSSTPNFNEKFMNTLDWYSMILCQTGKPEPGIVPPSALVNKKCVSEFLEFVLEEHCIELYFPKSLITVSITPSENGVLPLSTTAHPLTLADSNYGYKRFYADTGELTVIEVTIDPSYLENNQNIIVARPYLTSDCATGPAAMDFTLFLAWDN